jgi:hypothetical protein
MIHSGTDVPSFIDNHLYILLIKLISSSFYSFSLMLIVDALDNVLCFHDDNVDADKNFVSVITEITILSMPKGHGLACNQNSFKI